MECVGDVLAEAFGGTAPRPGGRERPSSPSKTASESFEQISQLTMLDRSSRVLLVPTVVSVYPEVVASVSRATLASRSSRLDSPTRTVHCPFSVSKLSRVPTLLSERMVTRAPARIVATSSWVLKRAAAGALHTPAATSSIEGPDMALDVHFLAHHTSLGSRVARSGPAQVWRRGATYGLRITASSAQVGTPFLRLNI